MPEKDPAEFFSCSMVFDADFRVKKTAAWRFRFFKGKKHSFFVFLGNCFFFLFHLSKGSDTKSTGFFK